MRLVFEIGKLERRMTMRYVDVETRSRRYNLLAQFPSAEPRFNILAVSRSVLSARHFFYVVFERYVLPSKDMQVDARIGVGGDFAVEDLVVHRNFTNAEFNDTFFRFSNNAHGQRACECSREESEKREEDDEESRPLHVERDESNEGKGK